MLPDNQYFNHKHFGLAITSAAIRAVEVDSAGKVLHYAESLFPQPVFNGSEVNVELLSSTIKQAVSQGNFSYKYAAVSIPEKYAYSREHTISSTDNHEITEAVSWQIEKIFPFPSKDIYFDWKLLRKNETESRVFVVAITRNLLHDVKAAFDIAGVVPIGFEPSASSLARLLPAAEKTPTILVEMDQQESTSTLVIDGVSSLTSTAIHNPQDPPETALQAISQAIDSLSQHARVSLDIQDAPKVVVTGDRASQEMADHLNRVTQQTTELLKIEGVNPAYHLAYIASRSSIEPPASDKSINLMPTILQLHYQAKADYFIGRRSIKYIVGLVMAQICVSLIVFGLSTYKLSQLQRLHEISSQPIDFQKITSTSEATVPEINMAAQRFMKLFPNKVGPESVLNTVLNAVPNDVVISSFSYETNKKQLRLTGTAKTRDDLLLLRQRLNDTQSFSGIKLPLSSLGSYDNVPFTMEFLYKGEKNQ